MNRERPPELRRTTTFQASVTPSQKERIKAAAYAREMITSEFVRSVVLAEVEKIEREQARRERGSK